MDRLIEAITDEKFSHVKTIVFQNHSLLSQVFYRGGESYTALKLAEEYASTSGKNTQANRIVKYLKNQGAAYPPPPSLRNLLGAVEEEDLAKVKQILNINPALINEEYTLPSGEPYTPLKRAMDRALRYPHPNSPPQEIVRELRNRGGIIPAPPPIQRRPGIPPLSPPLYTRVPRNLTRGIASKARRGGGRRRGTRKAARSVAKAGKN
jgi:hypothetical protein